MNPARPRTGCAAVATLTVYGANDPRRAVLLGAMLRGTNRRLFNQIPMLLEGAPACRSTLNPFHARSVGESSEGSRGPTQG